MQPGEAIQVLLVEDEADLRDTLCRYLSEIGMEARGVATAEDLWVELQRAPADVVVLDINLPGESGFSAAARLRVTTRAGIVLMTARAPAEDRLLGLSVGADHYLVKPVRPVELELIIRNLHKRLSQDRTVATAETWIFDAKTWTLRPPVGPHTQVSKAEFSILSHLMQHAGVPVSRDQLRSLVSALGQDGAGRSVDTIIYRLRRRIASECGIALPVHTARGIGYVFAAEAEILNGNLA